MSRRAAFLALAPLALAACHSSDRTPGSTSAAEDQQLNDAAVMLDANSMNAANADITEVSGGEGDEAGDTGSGDNGE